MASMLHLFLFFFFQAEDGIRDLTVTGVQTCALPISHRVRRPARHPADYQATAPAGVSASGVPAGTRHDRFDRAPQAPQGDCLQPRGVFLVLRGGRMDGGIERSIAFLYGLQRHGIKPGLGRTLALLRALGDPHRAFPAIHVGGTNGKGSTAAMLAAILASQGYRVGLYTSDRKSTRLNSSHSQISYAVF